MQGHGHCVKLFFRVHNTDSVPRRARQLLAGLKDLFFFVPMERMRRCAPPAFTMLSISHTLC